MRFTLKRIDAEWSYCKSNVIKNLVCFIMGLIISDEAILLVTGFGMVSVIAIVLITKIQKTTFTFHMMWDVIYGYDYKDIMWLLEKPLYLQIFWWQIEKIIFGPSLLL